MILEGRGVLLSLVKDSNDLTKTGHKLNENSIPVSISIDYVMYLLKNSSSVETNDNIDFLPLAVEW